MTSDPSQEPTDASDATVEKTAHEIEQTIETYQQRTPDLYYTHSGRMGFAAPLILIIGLPVIAILAALYSYIVVYCPVVGYVNILFAGGYIFAAGSVISFLGHVGKCRIFFVNFSDSSAHKEDAVRTTSDKQTKDS